MPKSIAARGVMVAAARQGCAISMSTFLHSSGFDRRPRKPALMVGVLLTAMLSSALVQASAESKDKSPLPASSTSHPSTMTCPLDQARAAQREHPATLRVLEDKTCLINVREIKSSAVSIYDLRER